MYQVINYFFYINNRFPPNLRGKNLSYMSFPDDGIVPYVLLYLGSNCGDDYVNGRWPSEY